MAISPGQLDYRATPNHGGDPGGIRGSAQGYDDALDVDASPTAPQTDYTWKSYDGTDDAYRFNGINTPGEQARLHAEPDPATGAVGWSPDLAGRLTWSRRIDGSPPR